MTTLARGSSRPSPICSATRASAASVARRGCELDGLDLSATLPCPTAPCVDDRRRARVAVRRDRRVRRRSRAPWRACAGAASATVARHARRATCARCIEPDASRATARPIPIADDHDRPRAAGPRRRRCSSCPLAPLCREPAPASCPDLRGRPQRGRLLGRRRPTPTPLGALDVLRLPSAGRRFDPGPARSLASPSPLARGSTMAVPKKKTSKAKSRSRRASAWTLNAPAAASAPVAAPPSCRTSCAATAAGTTAARPSTSTDALGDPLVLVLPIAVDAMGGDNAPGEIVAGAPRAADDARRSRSCSSAGRRTLGD